MKLIGRLWEYFNEAPRASRGRAVKCAIDIATKKLANGAEISEGSRDPRARSRSSKSSNKNQFP